MGGWVLIKMEFVIKKIKITENTPLQYSTYNLGQNAHLLFTFLSKNVSIHWWRTFCRNWLNIFLIFSIRAPDRIKSTTFSGNLSFPQKMAKKTFLLIGPPRNEGKGTYKKNRPSVLLSVLPLVTAISPDCLDGFFWKFQENSKLR